MKFDVPKINGRLPVETMQRVLGNLARPEKEKKPLVVSYYITFRCNAGCEFCSQYEKVQEARRGLNQSQDPELAKQKEVLQTIRSDVPNIYILGGEPTVHPHFAEILETCSDLEFESVSVNTNGILYRPEILDHANLLVVSLHSTDPHRLASTYDVHPKAAERAIENIKRYSKERDPGRTKMALNCVITGNNIREIYRIAEFCEQLGVQMNVSPAILALGKPDPNLVNNPEYQRLIDWLMGKTHIMASTRTYLESIRDFKPFTCTPHVVPGIHPNGDMIVPCPNLENPPAMVNILSAKGVNRALKAGRAEYESTNGILNTQRECRDRCHKACYVEGAELGSLIGIGKMVKHSRQKV